MNQTEYIKLSVEKNLSHQNLLVLYGLMVDGAFTNFKFNNYIKALDHHSSLSNRCDRALKTLLKDISNKYSRVH